ncbi:MULTISPECIES: hypothetical protein [unclassified Anabaena]|uniref:hypothetical protein n=1 Tax=unclassified Anabaena TaxID=2619674 RepID=UPI0006AC05B6|nr:MULTISPECIES: hypothetical protein [unclassified Anabaena]ALB39880.1 hypothetical protein AA650_04855 [Anabaena sp. WA102]OBQ17620.1 MAG: hypothetical protein AN486_14460 [Anabaena sp. AL93]
MEFLVAKVVGRLLLFILIPICIAGFGFAAIFFGEIFIRLPKLVRYFGYSFMGLPMMYVSLQLLFEREFAAALLGFMIEGLILGVCYRMEEFEVKQR